RALAAAAVDASRSAGVAAVPGGAASTAAALDRSDDRGLSGSLPLLGGETAGLFLGVPAGRAEAHPQSHHRPGAARVPAPCRGPAPSLSRLGLCAGAVTFRFSTLVPGDRLARRADRRPETCLESIPLLPPVCRAQPEPGGGRGGDAPPRTGRGGAKPAPLYP